VKCAVFNSMDRCSNTFIGLIQIGIRPAILHITTIGIIFFGKTGKYVIPIQVGAKEQLGFVQTR
jgi:hypothetical protein